MINLNTTAGAFSTALKLMGVPIGGSNMFFSTIAPTFHPDGTVTLKTQSNALIQTSIFKSLHCSGIIEDMKIAMAPAKLLQYLDLYNETDKINVSYSVQDATWSITDLEETGFKDNVSIPGIAMDEVQSTIDQLPITLDDMGLPVYAGGTKPTEVKAVLDVKVLQALISRVTKAKLDPAIYAFDIMGGNRIRMQIGSLTKRDKDVITTESPIIESVHKTKTSQPGDILCSCAHSLGFPDVINNLSGTIELHCINKGPLWLTTESPDYKVSYMIAPAIYE